MISSSSIFFIYIFIDRLSMVTSIYLDNCLYFRIVWVSSLERWTEDVTPEGWEWMLKDGRFSPKWMTIREASKACAELLKWGCKTKCRGLCKCRKNSLQCTEFWIAMGRELLWELGYRLLHILTCVTYVYDFYDL